MIFILYMSLKMERTWALWLNMDGQTSYNWETLVGAWKKVTRAWTSKQTSYDSCIWRRVNEEILVDERGCAIIRDVDNWLKQVLLSKWPRKLNEEVWWVSFKLIKVICMWWYDSEEEDEKKYTDY